MPVYLDKDKNRWRFSFNRKIGSDRHRATKLLPAAWGRAKAEAYDRAETSRLYAVATGVERPEPLIEQAVELYLDHRIPKLVDGKGIAQELAFLAGYIEGRPMSQLADAGREYAADNEETLEPGTIRNRLAYLRAACRYAWRKHKLTPHDPTGQMEFPEVNNIRDVELPVSKYEKHLKRIENDEARALFTLAFYTGSRWPSEILPRAPKDVHRIVVKGKAKVLIFVGYTKNGSPRLVPVPPQARWTLKYLPTFNAVVLRSLQRGQGAIRTSGVGAPRWQAYCRHAYPAEQGDAGGRFGGAASQALGIEREVCTPRN